MVFNLVRQFAKLSNQSKDKQRLRRKFNVRRAFLEQLERREVLATYVVLNTADAGPGSLRAAIELANVDAETDSIEFDLAAGSQTIQLQSTLVISNNVEIFGPGSGLLTIDGRNSVRLFEVTDSVSTDVFADISGLTLQNGNAGETGDGGAIYSSNADLYLDQVTLRNNRGRNGGAIYVENLADEQSSFFNSVSVYVTESVFDSNRAVNGGAVYNNKAHVEITSGSTVLNNVASTDGGAFYTIGIPQINTPTTLWVYDSTVSGNVATNGSGGAVFADTDQLEFFGSTVSNNRAAISGGAIFASSNAGFVGDELFRSQSLQVTNSTFTSNSAGERGGAIHGVGYQISINQSSIVGSTAAEGGAIYVEDNGAGISSMFADATTFENNTAQGATELDGLGGAIFSFSGSTNFGGNTRFINNRAIGGNGGGSGKGGAIYSEEYIFISWATFIGNTASVGDSEGGAIWSNSPFQQAIYNATFSNNTANTGGALYLLGDTTVNSSTLNNNSALTGAGGGVWTSNRFVSSNSTIHANSAATDGGGVYIGVSESNSELLHVTLTDNRADSDGNGSGLGGGVFTNNPVRLTNSIVAGNLVGTGSTREDVRGTVTASSPGNLVSVNVGFSGITQGSNSNQIGTLAAPIDPLLGPLKDNGGKTQTRALLNGSPAINRAAVTFALSTDQRNDLFDSNFGTPRGTQPDIGAYERVFDFGDAASNYPVTSGSNGARHEMTSNLYLGFAVDSNTDGLPTVDASGDDSNFRDDEDGVVFRSMTSTFLARADVTASAAGLLTGWIDLNRDGDWNDAGEQILTDKPVTAGVNPVDFSVGSIDFAGANFVLTYARFRISTQAGLSSTGTAPDGEVEDYRIRIEKVVLPTNPTIPGGPFTFTEEPVIRRVFRGYDPLYATGYDYAVQSGPSFSLLQLPPGYGDDAFTVTFVDGSGSSVIVPFTAGQTVDFENGLVDDQFVFTGTGSVGITSFRIEGIELSAAVNATSDLAFLTYIGFTANGNASFTQTPISVLVAFNDSGATGENTVLNVASPGILANDTYAGASLTVTEVNGVGANVGAVTALASGATVRVNADGSYSYDPRTAFDYLPAGVNATDTFTYKVSDGPRTAIATVTINLTGVNDVATIAGDSAGSVTEDSATGAASGNLTVSDVDTGEAKFVSGSLTGTYGSFTFNNATGAWTYTLDNSAAATNALSAGQIANDTLTVTSFDGTATKTIDVTITGSNDAATITGTATGAVTEDAATTTSTGTLTVADVDSPLTFQIPASLAGTYGNFTFDTTSGTWVYTLDNADPDTNALAAGAIAHDTLTVTSNDGTATQVIDVTITGANDAATITGTATGAVTEDAATTTATGTLAVTDVDSPLTFQTPASLAGTYGNFTFDTTSGTWVYTLDNADPDTNALAAGALVRDTLTVNSSDGTATQIIAVTITGANDAATITGTATGAVTEDVATTTATGTLTVTDVDSPLTFQTPASLAGTYGNFTFDTTSGTWVYTLDNSDADTNALAAGALVRDTLTVNSSDGTATQIIAVTITGANDAATITGTATGAVTEDAATTTATGTLTVADVDSPLTFQTPASLAGTYGSFTFSTSSGAWVYTLNNADPDTNALAAGAIVRDTLTVRSSDGTASRVIDVTITGANDAATITGTSTGTVTEDATVSTVTGILTVVDVDSPQNFRTPATLVGTYGSFTFNAATGAWTYALDNSDPDTNALATGQVVREFLTVTSNDGTASRQIDITINGTNDGVVNNPPTASITGPTSGVRGQELSFTLAANDSPADRAAGFRYTIRWGDGTPDTVIARTANNSTGVVVKHIFAATGSFNISVVATDQANAASAPATRTVAIAAMSVQTDPRNPAGKALFIGGTTGDDCIELYRQSGQLRVKMNGVVSSYGVVLTNIVVFGQAGNDKIDVGSTVATPAMLFGGDGNDLIKAGTGATVLSGGAGNDFLYGGSARDILIGGLGRDVLFGNGDGDILIGSTTAHDSDLGVLGAIVSEWSSTRTYQTRVNNLRSRLNTTTVVDDRAADILWGSSGLDWYFAELRKTTRDQVYSSSGEIVESLL